MSLHTLKKIGQITAITLLLLSGLFWEAKAATLNISPSSASVEPGQTVNVDVQLDTKGIEIDGVDFYHLKFNPQLLEVVDSNPSVSGVQITPGNSLSLTLANSVNNSTGLILFSQTVTAGTTFKGTAKLATISFKAKAAGTANISFDFKPGETRDTNVASKGADALTSVGSAKLTVLGSQIASEPTPSPNPSAELSPGIEPGTEEPVINPSSDAEANADETGDDAEGGSSGMFVWIGLALFLVFATGVVFRFIKK